ncbi:putative wall-associated receptor kinase-like 16 [Cajanus cajan]|uniref:putative wall-associated receptor kinase-like 16 n=1 Tax=Cajanus cajan TaxID=3821 RepID=UPI0010FBB02D|nr:putative wall-associated receptor kinase-like 16 [Cajanus cajan]
MRKMGLKATQMLFMIVLVRIGLGSDEADHDLAMDGCRSSCGKVSVPYPFGIGNSSFTGDRCFLAPELELRCIDADSLYRGHGNVQILNITLQGKMDMLAAVSHVCIDKSEGREATWGEEWTLSTPAFAISSEDNKFVSVGCDTYGYLNSYVNGTKSSTGCLTRCDSKESMQSMQSHGNCTGIGCCQVNIPPGMKNISIQAFSFYNFNSSFGFNNCSTSFVVKNGSYTFSLDHLNHIPFNEAPFVVDWTVGNDTCRNSEGTTDNYACKNNSYCEDSNTGYGYRCKCRAGFEGNPYLPQGCRDIDECLKGTHTCINVKNCHNTIGNYTCSCRKWQSGNGKERDCRIHTMVVVGAAVGFVILFVGTVMLYLIHQKRKLSKLKEKFFRQNGGLILLQKLSRREDTSQIAQIFTEEQLKKATNNFDETSIIGRGGFGTVFKGFLVDNRIVAIKKSKILDESQKEQFINEVIILSQINHRNVVKLLGCCLETEVPLLVYEFVENGTLYDFIHTEGKVNNEIWKTRVRIAAEVAGSLSYLHSATSVPIIHRDVKTTNILLDNTYTAKVSDFGASRLVPLGQTEIATMVQGTFGYLDPEYMLTSQLTEKSDVYSFGVVLVELLTGENPHSFGKLEEKKTLANHFLSCFKGDCLFDVLQVGIVNEENKKEVMDVAILAANCLRLNGEERPSMKEVAMELERIRLKEKHPWINTDQNLEETQHLLHETSSNTYEPSNSSNHQYSGYDSIKGRVLVALDDGR